MMAISSINGKSCISQGKMAEKDTIRWSTTFYSIREAIANGLPTLVKVSEGFYSEDEDSLSAGDLIELKQLKTCHKVVAEFLNHPQIQETVVPIELAGKMRVLSPKELINSVDELIKICPRFVSLEKDLSVSRNYGGECFHLKTGDILEIDRKIQNVGIVCQFGNCEVFLNCSQDCQFRVMTESLDYTLKEIVEHFKLPQKVFCSRTDKSMVSQLHDQNLSGFVKLVREITDEVVVGYHKSSENSNDPSYDSEQVLLQLDSPEIKEIEVQIAEYDYQAPYGNVYRRCFSESSALPNVSKWTEEKPEPLDLQKTENNYVTMYDLAVDKHKRGGTTVLAMSNSEISLDSTESCNDYEDMRTPGSTTVQAESKSQESLDSTDSCHDYEDVHTSVSTDVKRKRKKRLTSSIHDMIFGKYQTKSTFIKPSNRSKFFSLPAVFRKKRKTAKEHFGGEVRESSSTDMLNNFPDISKMSLSQNSNS